MSTLDTYTDTDRTAHDRAKAAIARRLATDHRGKANAVSSRELAEGVEPKATTVRDLIPEIRREYGLPIASANGYYVAETREEAAEFIERQKRQAETSLETARQFARVWNGGGP